MEYCYGIFFVIKESEVTAGRYLNKYEKSFLQNEEGYRDGRL